MCIFSKSEDYGLKNVNSRPKLFKLMQIKQLQDSKSTKYSFTNDNKRL